MTCDQVAQRCCWGPAPSSMSAMTFSPGRSLPSREARALACAVMTRNLLARPDRRWLTGKIATHHPDVLVAGPLYKLYQGGGHDEESAAELADYFDRLRAEYDLTLLLEAHSPYGADGGTRRALRPIGPSLWSRWPEFGKGLRKTDENGVYDFESWIPDRDDDRAWPTRIYRGTGWPWVNAHLAESDEPAF